MSCSSTTADFRPAQYNIQLWRNDSWVQTAGTSRRFSGQITNDYYPSITIEMGYGSCPP